MSIKFLPTPEQKNISDSLVTAIAFGENDFVLPCQAPAGTGKTQLTASFMKDLQLKMPEKKVGYFIFNSFMKDEINKRAYALEIYNSSFFTYHSFLLQHALKNEKLKVHFYDKDGNIRIDFAKQGYSKDEVGRTVTAIVGNGRSPAILTDFLYTAFNEWLNSDETLMEYATNTMNKIYGTTKEIEQAQEESLPESFEMIRMMRHEFEALMQEAKKPIVSRIAKAMPENLSADKIGILFLAQGMTHILKTNKLSHSAYYKEVYNIATKEKIDLFEEFDAIIVDEAQDMDKVFKRLIEHANKPTMVIGDSSQSIYAWRGAVNMMEDVMKSHESHSLSYSFRYDNDIAQLSNLLLLDKEDAPAVFVNGKYTDKIKNIIDELVTPEKMAEQIANTVNKRLHLCERIEGISPENMKTKELRKYLTKEKVAFLSRNNSTLIDTLFKVLPYIRTYENSEHIHISLTDTVTEDFTKIKDGDFGAQTNKRISEMVGMDYKKFKGNKTLDELLQDHRVRNVIHDNNKINFLLDSERYENFKFLIRQLFPRGEDFIKVNNCDFGIKTNKRIAEKLGVEYKEYKKGKTLREMLNNDKVREIIEDNELVNFLLDDKKLTDFETIVAFSKDNGKNFLEIKNKDFGTTTNKRIFELIGIPMREYRNGVALDELLKDEMIRKAISENPNISFLLDKKLFETFKLIMNNLSPRSADSISKNNDLSNFEFSTIHGAKGKEYSYTYVASDILKPNNEGVVTEEEYNIAYVAITRTKGKLYFMDNMNGNPHYLHSFYQENKGRLLEILNEDYTYTFPYGVEMKISKLSKNKETSLYSHTIKEPYGNMGIFVIPEPITSGLIGYQAEESVRHIKYRGEDHKEKAITFDGENIKLNKKDNVTYYYYGVGKTANEINLLKKKDRNIKIGKNEEIVAPRYKI